MLHDYFSPEYASRIEVQHDAETREDYRADEVTDEEMQRLFAEASEEEMVRAAGLELSWEEANLLWGHVRLVP